MAAFEVSEEATDVREPTEPQSTVSKAFTLTVIEGPDAGKAFAIDLGAAMPTLVGQSPACSVQLTDRKVSRRHASFDPSGASLFVSDLGSTNGTSVDGLRVSGAYLTGGEVVRLGDTALRVDTRVDAPRTPMSKATSFGQIIGSSPAMQRIYPLCEQLARSDLPLVIEGETGTGKEVLAESLHEAGKRAAGPFIVFDCTAVAPNLAESELFGHERGAFTGAVTSRAGVFEQAHGGTLLIDEIGDLPASLQPKLLRVLERGAVRRVGGNKWIEVSARVMAATRRDLDREVQDGRFRDDLFFRLAVARIVLPPLRARKGDIGVLTEYLWRRLGGGDEPVPYELLQRFERYAWPGNVRELANAVGRFLALGDLGEVDSPASHSHRGSTDAIDDVLAEDLPFPRARDRVVEEFERRYVTRVLEKNDGSVPRAARASGIARRYFSLILARHR